MTDDKEVRRPGVWEEMFPGRFLKATALGILMATRDGQLKTYNFVTLMIADVTLESMPTDKGGEQTRGILSFKQTPMQLAINKTNGVCLRAMFGVKPAEWVGKRLTLVPEKDKFGRETVDAIRISGSPDLTEVLEVEIRMPRKKPKTRRLVPTGRTANGNGTVKPPDPPPPQSEPAATDDDYNDTGELSDEQERRAFT